MALNTVTYDETPQLFDDIEHNLLCHTQNQHSDRSWFRRKSLITFGAEHMDNYPEVPNYAELIGVWETNEYEINLNDPEFKEGETIHTLHRVIPRPPIK